MTTKYTSNLHRNSTKMAQTYGLIQNYTASQKPEANEQAPDFKVFEVGQPKKGRLVKDYSKRRSNGESYKAKSCKNSRKRAPKNEGILHS